MNFLEEIKNTIGEETYNKLERLADREVGKALNFSLKDKYQQDRYFSKEISITELLDELKLFEEKGLQISPLDVTNILFKCKLFTAINDEAEHNRRTDGHAYPEEFKFLIPWGDKSLSYDDLISKYFERQKNFIKDRILVTHIEHFNSGNDDVQSFFEKLFNDLNQPFLCFFENSGLIEKHKRYEPGLKKYEEKDTKEFFSAPSFGYKVHGSQMYCYFYATTYLRTFLSMLRIGSFIHPPQIDFGHTIQITAPTSSVFLGTFSSGCYCWDEDQKEPWRKSADGCLFLSFGYRGISPMWLDQRAFGSLEKFFIEHKIIFDKLINPWNEKPINDIAPIIDILSSATQIQDVGAKILLLYCALEHLFVPSGINHDNKKYIIGGINALDSALISWFSRLYNLRCEYAHKGFILRNDSTRSVTMESMQNVMKLLLLKLSK